MSAKYSLPGRLTPVTVLTICRAPHVERLTSDRREAWKSLERHLDVRAGQASVQDLLAVLPALVRGRSGDECSAGEFLEQCVRNAWLVTA